MKKLYTTLFALAALTFMPLVSNAQCTTWVNPTDSSAWTDFTTAFNGAPCDDGSGCPFNEITAFEIWADEAYFLENTLQGGVYTWSVCNGVGGTAWNLEVTVIAPSGTVDAFGLDAGSICELTWTASENGTYTIVISEAGACGTSSNTSTDNGFPAVTCQTGTASCTAIGINEVDGTTPISIFPNPSTGQFTINADVDVSNVQVIDINGRTVQNINTQNINGQVTFDLSGKPAGTYMVNVISNDVMISERISLID